MMSINGSIVVINGGVVETEIVVLLKVLLTTLKRHFQLWPHIADEVYSRIFNHKPFIEGEIRYMIGHYEESHDDSEINQLFETLERTTDTKDTRIDSVTKFCQNNFNQINASLDSLLDSAKEILELESIHSSIRDQQLKETRESRSKELCSFVELMKRQQSDIDSVYEEKETKLRQFYGDLEIKLRIGTNGSLPFVSN